MKVPDRRKKGPTRLIIADETACYHIFFRTVRDSRWLLDAEKAAITYYLYVHAAFCGLEVLSYCILDNHIHLLVRIPHIPDQKITDKMLHFRYTCLYGKHRPANMPDSQEFLQILESDDAISEVWRNRLKRRMNSLTHFVREFKQRITIWYNQHNRNEGTIWGGCYTSVLVENDWKSLSLFAAYINLNPVRAGIVSDPAHYRFCSYAEMVQDMDYMKTGLRSIYKNCDKTDLALKEDFEWLLSGVRDNRDIYADLDTEGVELTRAGRKKIPASIRDVPIPHMLRYRVRYFTCGGAVGSEAFINNFVNANSQLPLVKRKKRCTRFKNSDWRGLHSLRALQKDLYI